MELSAQKVSTVQEGQVVDVWDVINDPLEEDPNSKSWKGTVPVMTVLINLKQLFQCG